MPNEDRFHLGIKALIRNTEGKVLLLKVNVRALRKYNGEAYWDIPGGRIQVGDSIESALRREIHEETGLTEVVTFSFFTASLANIRIPLDKETVGLVLFTYLCEIDGSQPITISDEHTESRWFSPNEAAELLRVKYPDDFVVKVRSLGILN